MIFAVSLCFDPGIVWTRFHLDLDLLFSTRRVPCLPARVYTFVCNRVHFKVNPNHVIKQNAEDMPAF